MQKMGDKNSHHTCILTLGQLIGRRDKQIILTHTQATMHPGLGRQRSRENANRQPTKTMARPL